MQPFNVENFRAQFPLLKTQLNYQHGHQQYNQPDTQLNHSPLIYFDNAATTQKPQCVIDAYQKYYQQYNANVHRASHQLSAMSTAAFEQARTNVKHFINASDLEEIIWTKGTTESLNLLAHSLGELVIEAGDEIILSQAEHHANIVPWQMLAQRKSAIIKVVPLTHTGVIDIKALQQLFSEKTKIMSFAHIANVIGKINPIDTIVDLCKKHKVITIIDGAQAIGHELVNVQAIDCDFYVFSAHKMYGPTGVGVLYGKREYLNKMPPYQGGGEMISQVSFSKTTYNKLPFKFEAGTPNIAGVIAFSSAINFISNLGMDKILAYENKLLRYCYEQLKAISKLNFVVENVPHIPLFSFIIKDHHNHDVATYLDAHNIAVRSGHHCAMPLMEYFQCDGCIRVALTAYNTFEEVDQLVFLLKQLLNNEKDIQPNNIQPNKKTQVIINNQATPNTNPTVNNKPENQQSTFITCSELIKKFTLLKSWDSRHREIMMLGKAHPRLSHAQLTDNNLIQGCESKAWLAYTVEQGRYQFKADSDAKVIRGLLVIILAAYNNQTAKYIVNFNIEQYFDELGLIQQLSPSRANGLMAIVCKIKSIVDK